MNVLKVVTVFISAALIRATSYNTEFRMSYICDSSAVAMSFIYYGDVASDIICGTHCARHSDCLSFSFVSANSTCMLNDGLIADNRTCENSIQYGIKMVKSVCTESVGNVRLCNGSGHDTADSSKGRVELLYDDQWGSVCDDNWEIYNHGHVNAKVVCGMFGFQNGVANISAAFGESSGPIYLDSVVCNGTEASIMDCSHDDVEVHNCSHGEDVGVVCF